MLTNNIISHKLVDFESGNLKFEYEEIMELLQALVDNDMLKDLPLIYSSIINIYIKSGQLKGEYITTHPSLPSKVNIDNYEPQIL